MSKFKKLDFFGAFSETPVTENKDENTIPISANEESVAKDEINDSSADGAENNPTENNKEEIIGNVLDEMADKESESIESETKTQEDNKIDTLIELQKVILEQIQSLDNLFNTRIMHTDHEEKIVDQMHKELYKYKEDMYYQLVRPILLDIIEVRDSIIRVGAAYLAKTEGERDIPNKTFSDYAYDLQDILEKNSVEIYRSKSGDDFTPIKQRAIKKVPTNDNALHGKVAESLSCGYSYNGKIISAEKTTVYVYEENTENK